jgi:AraC family transcriptional regulator of adaptative response / DNA-3-methyladenine glycosylase II
MSPSRRFRTSARLPIGKGQVRKWRDGAAAVGIMRAMLDHDACYRALLTRDARFDGRFFIAVTSTGIYCRPICPARPPKLENCVFMPSAAAAQAAGFRPCLRCRPEAAPELAVWRGTANTVSRALRLIDEGALDEGDVETLAGRLGVGGRHLRRLFQHHLGAPPVAVAQTRRLLFAKALLADTALPMTEVALASGYDSLRRFNDAMRRSWDRPPSALRRPSRTPPPGNGGVTIRLPYQPPFDWAAFLGFLGPRAIPGVEAVEGDCYRRTIAFDGRHGVVELRPAADAPQLEATIRIPAVGSLGTIVSRLKRQFDLDADATTIGAHLATDPLLAPLVAARPGLRVPGAWDPFELAVRAILGQQISVGAATVLAGRVAAAYGEALQLDDGPAPAGLTHVFPAPVALIAADPGVLRVPRARAACIAGLAAALAERPDLLSPVLPLDETVALLCRLPGIGPWTAQYVAMRALREPDAFPSGDLGLRKAAATADGVPTMQALEARSAAWRPWRAYAAIHLWFSLAKVGGG